MRVSVALLLSGMGVSGGGGRWEVLVWVLGNEELFLLLPMRNSVCARVCVCVHMPS